MKYTKIIYIFLFIVGCTEMKRSEPESAITVGSRCGPAIIGDFKFKDSKIKTLFERANEDFERLAKNKNPKFAKSSGSRLDGGTQIYEGEGYKITQLRKFVTLSDGTTGILFGPTLEIRDQIKSGEDKISCIFLLKSEEEIEKLMR